MSGRIVGRQRHLGDDGSAGPGVEAALAAFAAGRLGEHAALAVLARSRLLTPLVAVPAVAGDVPAAVNEEMPAAVQGASPTGVNGEVPAAAGEGVPAAGTAAPAGPGGGDRRPRRNETEMAVPTLVGRDGRHAVLAFTCLEALARWRADARPVPVPAAQVWQAGVQDASAVVIDVAGPVPMVVDGARLAALAGGRAAPPAHEDPDLLAAARGALAGEPAIAGVRLLPAAAGGDLMLHLTIAPGYAALDPAVEAAAESTAAALTAAAAGRLRRGVEVALTESGP